LEFSRSSRRAGLTADRRILRRREPAAPQQQPDPAAQAIQSKPFGEGGTLALTKVKVVGQILNVEFMYIPPKNERGDYKFTNEHSGKITDFAYVDEATSKRISLLQDESGKYMTDPAAGVSNTIGLTGNSPKIIALTNRWTWHNPFYGIIIRYADFVPVENGIEENMGKIRMLVDKGYSVLVFPEGSRSEDCSIGRFRQGAFYLAKVLRLDIVPIVLHGVGHILPKKEFVLRRGQVDVVIDQRISLADLETTLSQRDSDTNDLDTRAVAKYFCSLLREKYDILADKVETPQYFADKVMKNYIYKGSRIARIAKKELQRYGNYSSVISTLPDRGKILIKNCGQGVLPLMAALIKRNLTIEATEADPDKLDIACNCHSIPKNLVYIDHIDPAVTYDKVIDCLSL